MAAYDPTDIEGQTAAQERANDIAQVRANLEASDFKWILSNRRGRRFIWRLLEQAGVFRTSFTSDPHSTAFNEGQRNAGLRILDLINRAAPDVYAVMLKEAKDYDRN